jgi:hypothetical protein
MSGLVLSGKLRQYSKSKESFTLADLLVGG